MKICPESIRTFSLLAPGLDPKLGTRSGATRRTQQRFFKFFIFGVDCRLRLTYNIEALKRGDTSKHGCLAQLGEHLFDVQEVTGSIPVAPTMLEKFRVKRGFSFFD